MTIHGTESDINAALEGMTFTPDTNFSGAVNLQMTTSLGADLVGHYTFDAGNAIDDSVGISQNGTFVNNATTVTDGTRGEVLSLDGAGDSVQINGLFGNPTNITVAAWVNLSAATPDNADVISLGDSVTLRLDRDDGANPGAGVTGHFYDGTVWHRVASSQFIAGTGWHHVAYVVDDANDTHTIYIDGVALNSETTTTSVSYTRGTDTFIGAHGNGNVNYDFNGLIDDARIYTRALSADEIASIAADNTSDTGNVSITVNPVNDAPVLSGGINGTVFENGSGLVPFFTTGTVSDVDSADLAGGTMTFSVASGGDGSELLTLGAFAGVTTSGSDVLVSGIQVGTFTGGTSGTDLVITFDADATPARVEAVFKALAISVNSEDPTPGVRNLEVVLTDGDGGTSNIATSDVTFNAVNDAPVLDNTGTMTLHDDHGRPDWQRWSDGCVDHRLCRRRSHHGCG